MNTKLSLVLLAIAGVPLQAQGGESMLAGPGVVPRVASF